MIKIVFLTDIHDSLEELKILLQITKADLYLICGDILYYAFNDLERVLRFVTLQEEFYYLIKENKENIDPYDLATKILRDHKSKNTELYFKAAEYRLLFHSATKTMKEKYTYIEDIIQRYSNASCFVLPGNYDIDFNYTSLANRNLHKKIMYYENLIFAGYGGAPIPTSGIPEKLALPYLEGGKGSDFYSEPYEFFETAQPDIMVLHNPAYGYFDKVPHYGNIGSLGIRNYLDKHNPSIVLSGHIHEDYGFFLNSKGTIFLNTSNFGKVDSINGIMEGGSFAEIFIDKITKKVNQIVIKRLKNYTIYNFFKIHINYHDKPSFEINKLEHFNSFHLDFDQFIKNKDLFY
ncbi:MAG: metallophosphoesterase [Leptonema sp. (in: bacteria)]